MKLKLWKRIMMVSAASILAVTPVLVVTGCSYQHHSSTNNNNQVNKWADNTGQITKSLILNKEDPSNFDGNFSQGYIYQQDHLNEQISPLDNPELDNMGGDKNIVSNSDGCETWINSSSKNANELSKYCNQNPKTGSNAFSDIYKQQSSLGIAGIVTNGAGLITPNLVTSLVDKNYNIQVSQVGPIISQIKSEISGINLNNTLSILGNSIIQKILNFVGGSDKTILGLILGALNHTLWSSLNLLVNGSKTMSQDQILDSWDRNMFAKTIEAIDGIKARQPDASFIPTVIPQNITTSDLRKLFITKLIGFIGKNISNPLPKIELLIETPGFIVPFASYLIVSLIKNNLMNVQLNKKLTGNDYKNIIQYFISTLGPAFLNVNSFAKFLPKLLDNNMFLNSLFGPKLSVAIAGAIEGAFAFITPSDESLVLNIGGTAIDDLFSLMVLLTPYDLTKSNIDTVNLENILTYGYYRTYYSFFNSKTVLADDVTFDDLQKNYKNIFSADNFTKFIEAKDSIDVKSSLTFNLNSIINPASFAGPMLLSILKGNIFNSAALPSSKGILAKFNLKMIITAMYGLQTTIFENIDGFTKLATQIQKWYREPKTGEIKVSNSFLSSVNFNNDQFFKNFFGVPKGDERSVYLSATNFLTNIFATKDAQGNVNSINTSWVYAQAYNAAGLSLFATLFGVPKQDPNNPDVYGMSDISAQSIFAGQKSLFYDRDNVKKSVTENKFCQTKVKYINCMGVNAGMSAAKLSALNGNPGISIRNSIDFFGNIASHKLSTADMASIIAPMIGGLLTPILRYTVLGLSFSDDYKSLNVTDIKKLFDFIKNNIKTTQDLIDWILGKDNIEGSVIFKLVNTDYTPIAQALFLPINFTNDFQGMLKNLINKLDSYGWFKPLYKFIRTFLSGFLENEFHIQKYLDQIGNIENILLKVFNGIKKYGPEVFEFFTSQNNVGIVQILTEYGYQSSYLDVAFKDLSALSTAIENKINLEENMKYILKPVEDIINLIASLHWNAQLITELLNNQQFSKLINMVPFMGDLIQSMLEAMIKNPELDFAPVLKKLAIAIDYTTKSPDWWTTIFNPQTIPKGGVDKWNEALFNMLGFSFGSSTFGKNSLLDLIQSLKDSPILDATNDIISSMSSYDSNYLQKNMTDQINKNWKMSKVKVQTVKGIQELSYSLKYTKNSKTFTYNVVWFDESSRYSASSYSPIWKLNSLVKV